MNDATGMPQTAVVLGGTSDIAAEIVRALAARRLRHVVLAGRDEARLETRAATLRDGAGIRVDVVHWDAAADHHQPVAAEAARLLGEVDLVLMAAGILGQHGSGPIEPDETRRVFDANLAGPAAALSGFAQLLRSQGAGQIVVMSSVAGVRVRRSNFAYGASKAGLDAFAQGLADASWEDGVRVMIVRPGWVATRMTEGMAPGPMATTAGAVAVDVVRGLERGAAVVWSPSTLRFAFAALRLVPRRWWRRLEA